MKLQKVYKNISVRNIFLFALLIRLALLPFSFHSDLTTYAIWGKYASEFGLRGFYDWLNFGNYARPDYPPLAMILFLAVERFWQFLFSIFWKINVAIPAFPSNFIPWFEKEGLLTLIKLPGVIADLGIGYLIFNFFKKKSINKAKFASTLYLFNPAIIYLSAAWGQLDSIVGFLGLLAILLVIKEKYYASLTSFAASIMLKVTMAPSAIFLVLQSVKQKISFLRVTLLSFLTLLYLYTLGNIFIDKNPVVWSIDLYLGKLIKGAVTLPYINLNAFNFWGVVLGLERVSEQTLFMNIPINYWAWGITIFFALLVIWGYLKGRSIFFALAMLFFSIFMFASRVHERYLYPAILFFPIAIANNPKLKRFFWALSFIFLINLYHWWWFPKIEVLTVFFDLEVIERLLSLLNLAVFGIMLKEYARPLWQKKK